MLRQESRLRPTSITQPQPGRSHVRPDLVDACEAFFLGTDEPFSTPTCGRIAVAGPDGVLIVIVEHYSMKWCVTQYDPTLSPRVRWNTMNKNPDVVVVRGA
jgi:hypothetical protein